MRRSRHLARRIAVLAPLAAAAAQVNAAGQPQLAHASAAPGAAPTTQVSPTAQTLTRRERLYTGDVGQPRPEMADRIKNPVPWFNWGADLRVREEYFNNAITLDERAPGHEFNFQRYRTRLWGTFLPADWLDINARLLWEGRNYCRPDALAGWTDSDALFELLNVRLHPKDLPISATIGRQELNYGDGWLVLEGTPLDGSRSIFFDAAKFTLDLKDAKTSVDAVYINQYSDPDEWIPEINTINAPLIEQDERGAILYARNKSLQNTLIDGYGIYKHDDKVLANGDDSDIYTLGSRIAHDFDKNWNARLEGAYQFGNLNSASLSSWGLTGTVAYQFRDPMKNVLHFTYEYLSGDNPGTGTNEAFNPLWGRWPQFSELFIYTDIPETRVAQTTNLQRLNIGWQADPTPKLNLSAEYNLLLGNQNTVTSPFFSPDGIIRGHLFTAIAKYRFNRFVSGHLWGEYLIPGDFYADTHNDDAAYLRAEVVFTF